MLTHSVMFFYFLLRHTFCYFNFSFNSLLLFSFQFSFCHFVSFVFSFFSVIFIFSFLSFAFFICLFRLKQDIHIVIHATMLQSWSLNLNHENLSIFCLNQKRNHDLLWVPCSVCGSGSGCIKVSNIGLIHLFFIGIR